VLAVASRGNDVFAGGIFNLAGGQTSLRFGRYNPDIVPVVIQSFTAAPADRRVDLAWRMFADEPVQGIRIYRKAAGHSAFSVLNADGMISANARSFSDTDVRPGEAYHYRLAVVTSEGTETSSRVVEALVPQSSLILDQNSPNPFNPITTIRFSAPRGDRVRVDVYDVRGKLIVSLFDGAAPDGAQEVQWNGRDAGGAAVGSGVYFCRLQSGTRILTRKMMLLK
jgi:hypothetical protein